MAPTRATSNRPFTLTEAQESQSATLTRAQVAGLLGCDPRTVTRGIAEGAIPCVYVGRRVLIPRVPFLVIFTESSTDTSNGAVA